MTVTVTVPTLWLVLPFVAAVIGAWCSVSWWAWGRWVMPPIERRIRAHYDRRMAEIIGAVPDLGPRGEASQ